MAKYNSKKFLNIFNNFLEMFKTEGEQVYASILESIEEGYEHDSIPSNIETTVLKNILKDAFVEYYSSSVEIWNLEKYLIREKINE